MLNRYSQKAAAGPYWQQDGNKIYQGHVLDVLKEMASESVHCVVTSPPYWGL